MRVLIFGATGSIGSQTITVLKQIKYQLVGISFYNNIKKAKQIKCKYRYTPLYKNESNVKNYEELINKSKPDMIVNAVSGIAGLEITLLSIKHHIDIALANKESLVVAGKFVTKLAKKNKVNIYPIDSEHASLLQILKQIKDKPIELAITASGGKYYNKSNNELKNISYKNAIKHPTWHMGDKISIDSSTLMNKCFEIIEAYWLFDKNVYVYHCPTSFCHALCQYKNYYAMFEHKPDMKVHIKQALLKFKNKLPFIKTHNHNHLKLIKNTLPIKWAYDTIKNHDTTLPIILNAADETAINLFKQQKINYLDIIKLISKCVKQFKNHRINNVSDIYNLHNKVNKYLIDFYK